MFLLCVVLVYWWKESFVVVFLFDYIFYYILFLLFKDIFYVLVRYIIEGISFKLKNNSFYDFCLFLLKSNYCLVFGVFLDFL